MMCTCRKNFFVLIALFLVSIAAPAVAEEVLQPGALDIALLTPKVPLQLSADGKTMYGGIPPKAVFVDPDPPAIPRRILAPQYLTAEPEALTASFQIDYVPAGGTDFQGKTCAAFPASARTAFNAAANIWANTIRSSVPITIKACWADLGSSFILGYSGGGSVWRDFSGATQANTWYAWSLANALSGIDQDPGKVYGDYNMHITYNSLFSWYFGTDGNPSGTQFDFMSVVLHEIAHGLNFAGSMGCSDPASPPVVCNWGYGVTPAYPNIYDVFMRDGSGTQLIDTSTYPNHSTALDTVLRSDNIWFHGSRAMAENGNQRVKMYAPAIWSGGSSYSHLDDTAFPGQLMKFAIAAGEVIHDPGAVTNGLLGDLGWAATVTRPPSALDDFPWFMFLPAVIGGTSRGPATPPGPKTYWSAKSYAICPSSAATFSLTSSGVTKRSVMPAGGSDSTFEGWVTTTPGTRSFSWTITASTCGTWGNTFNYTLAEDKNYMFVLEVDSAGTPYVAVAINDGVPTASVAGEGLQSSSANAAVVDGLRQVIDTVPLNVPKNMFFSSRKGAAVLPE